MAGETILIVDSDVNGRMRTVNALRGMGLGVLTADDAISAVSVAVREQPAVVVLELSLPGGDGYQVMQRLQALPATAATPVVVCTDLDSAQHKGRALAAGAMHFVSKQAPADELAESLRFVLGPKPQSIAKATTAIPAGPRTVMLVDDDPDVRRTLTLLLKAQGYDVVAAEDAISAVSLAVTRRPEAVVLDVMLPGGQGFVVMERLRAVPSLSAVPVIIISGHDPRLLRQRAEDMGAVAFLEKPTDNQQLLDALRTALGEPLRSAAN